jgi:hypothetical protein
MKYRAGILRVSPEFIGELIRLPAGNKVVDAFVNKAGSIELTIEGDNMPERMNGLPIPEVSILCHHEQCPGDVERGGCQRRIVSQFEHMPNVKWVLRPWESVE